MQNLPFFIQTNMILVDAKDLKMKYLEIIDNVINQL